MRNNTAAKLRKELTKANWKIADHTTLDIKLHPFTCIEGANGHLIAEVCGSKEADDRHALAIAALPRIIEALDLHLAFLDSLPKGWLANTSGDVGLLNDAYIATGKAFRVMEGAGR